MSGYRSQGYKLANAARVLNQITRRKIIYRRNRTASTNVLLNNHIGQSTLRISSCNENIRVLTTPRPCRSIVSLICDPFIKQ